jgi:hypothetical protein
MPEKRYPNQENEHPNQRLPSISPTIKNPSDRYQHPPESCQQSAREWTRTALEIIALGALLCYAHSASIQATANVNAANAAKEAAHAAVSASRAWIVMTKEYTKDSKGNVIIGARIKNVGTTPAIQVVASEKVFLWNDGVLDVATTFPKLGPCPHPTKGKDFTVTSVITDSLGVSETADLPVDQKGLTNAQRQAFASQDKFVVVHGCVSYENVGHMGNGTTEFCLMERSSGFGFCPFWGNKLQ